MGRRPIAHRPKGGGMINSMDPEVRKEVNEVGLMLLREVKRRLGEKIDAGDMGELSMKELLAEYNKAVKSLQGPATTITAINVPQAPQEQVAQEDRAREIKNASIDPAKIEEMRERQEKYLEANGDAIS